MTNDDTARAATIRALNDKFRQTLQGGMVLFTAGIMALGTEAQATVLAAVQAFDAFDKGNDPWAEHDFGAIDIEVGKSGNGGPTERIFFKIDYYDLERARHAENPADPDKTERVMTIMLASEY